MRLGDRFLFIDYFNVPSSVEMVKSSVDEWGCIPGLCLVPDFLTEDEEREVLGWILNDAEMEFAVVKNRRVKHYGFIFDYRFAPLVTQPPVLIHLLLACILYLRTQQKLSSE